MKLVRHLIRFDLQSLSPVFALWAGVLVFQAIVLWIGPTLPVEGGPPAINLDYAAIVMRLAVTVVLVSVLVQRHLLVGTTAFWRTRPIPRTAVLVGTLTSAVLLTVAVPFLWFIAVFAWMGLDIPAAAHAAMTIAGEQAAVAAYALALASVSKNLAQMVVFGVGAMIAWGLGSQLMMGAQRRPVSFALVLHSGEWVGVVVLVATALIAALVSVYQHVTLKTTRSIGLIAASVMALVLLGRFPLWTVTEGLPVEVASESLHALEVALDPASIQVEHFSRTSSEGSPTGVHVAGTVNASANVGSVVLKPINVVAVIQFPDGASERFAPRSLYAQLVAGGQPTIADQPYASVAAAIEGATVAMPPANSGRYRITFLDVGEYTYAVRGRQPAILDVTLRFLAYRYTIAARVPLIVGRRGQGPRYDVEYKGALPIEDGVAVDIREIYIRDWYPIATTFYVLRNQRLKQAIVATNRREASFQSAVLDYSGILVSRTRLDVNLRTGAGQRVTVDRSWLDDAELLVLKPETLGRVSRSIRIDDFTLAPPPKAAQAPAKDQGPR